MRPARKVPFVPIAGSGQLVMIDIDKIVDAFRLGAFDIDCTSMVLRQGGRPLVRGTGVCQAS